MKSLLYHHCSSLDTDAQKPGFEDIRDTPVLGSHLPEIQECVQGSSQPHQYHTAAEEQGKPLNAGIDDQATGIQRAGAGRNSPKCRLGFVSPTLSHHQLPNKNACEGCASSLGKHSSELWWPQHTHSPAATDAAIQKWTQKTLVHVSHVKQQEGKKTP